MALLLSLLAHPKLCLQEEETSVHMDDDDDWNTLSPIQEIPSPHLPEDDEGRQDGHGPTPPTASSSHLPVEVREGSRRRKTADQAEERHIRPRLNETKQQEYSYGEKEFSNIDKIKRKERRERKENRTLYLVTLL